MATPKPLSPESAKDLQATMDKFTASPKKIPGVVFSTINKDGQQLCAHASGKLGVESESPMTLDAVFSIASCTKLVTAIAAVQLVEQDKLHLDDADEFEKILPELKAMKILKGFEGDKPSWTERKSRITLRMLLSHTSGFGYAIFEPYLRKYTSPIGNDEFSGYAEGIINLPLLHEPGERWRYGTGIDWAGIAVERTSGLSLDAYFKKHIFEPLGVEHTTFFPTQEMKEHLAYMNQKLPNGQIIPRDHFVRRPLVALPEEQATLFCSGGAGLFSKPTEYIKILAALLNGGQSATTSGRILQSKSVDLLLTNQIPEMPDFGRVPMQGAKALYSNEVPELYPQPHEMPQGWAFAGLVTIEGGATGRGRNTVHWAGLPNLFWWVDRTNGVAGMIGSQILPFADPELANLWVQAESAVYSAIASA